MTTDVIAGNILDNLRQGTRPLHDSLERRLNLLDPHLTRQNYFDLLRRFYGFYKPLEQRHPAYGSDPANWIEGDRRKCQWLITDLQYAGDDHAQIQSLDQCPRLPDLSQPFAQLGCMYVLEGASLGGQSILKHVRTLLALDGPGTAFFATYGYRVGVMWRSFCDRLLKMELNIEQQRRVVDSAVATFQTLDHWLLKERS